MAESVEAAQARVDRVKNGIADCKNNIERLTARIKELVADGDWTSREWFDANSELNLWEMKLSRATALAPIAQAQLEQAQLAAGITPTAADKAADAVEKKSAAAANNTPAPASPAPIIKEAPPVATGDDAAKPATANSSTSAATASVDAPGARIHNPLSELSSYTYHISLYMVTPEDYTNFVETGQADVSNFTVVCESGGSGKANANKAFPLDYYIDDLTFKTFCSTKTNDGPIVDSVNFEFKIYEPYGFSFVSELKAAALKVIDKSNLPGAKEASHHMQQNYMLGIEFYGYNEKGEIETGQRFGPSTNNNGTLFPRYFPIYLTHLSFRLDGRATTYAIKAQSVSINVAVGAIRSVIHNNLKIEGGTIEEILSGSSRKSLASVLNAQEEELLNSKPGGKLVERINKYVIKFIPNEAIAGATLVNPNDIPKYKAPMNNNTKTSESTEKTSTGLTFDKNSRTYTISAGSTIIQTIDNIISQSSYIRDALKSFPTESDAGNQVQVNSNPKPLKWYVITPIVKPIGYDKEYRSAYCYEITYQIREYLVPYVRSAYVSSASAYHGAHKKYSYIYTGKNNEILSYEQTYNALYYMNTLRQAANNTSPPVEVNVNARQAESDGGQNNLGGQGPASIKTSLYSPGDKALAKIQILGDPDYIMTTMGMEYQIYKKFYGPDYSINAAAGQIFIEINFNGASDYDTMTGLMNINDRVEVYKYPPELKIDGISYIVNDVTSTFSRGRFTQDLNLVLWSPSVNTQATSTTAPNMDETKRNIVAAITSGQTKQTNTGASADPVGFPKDTQVASATPTKASSATVAFQTASVSGASSASSASGGTQTADDDNSTTRADIAGLTPRNTFTI